MTKVIDVVAGIIYNSQQDHVLLSLRKPSQHQGDRWEFPGGKQEPGETQQAALARELFEELSITPLSTRFFQCLEHSYSDKSVRLHFWEVLSFEGEAIGRESQQINWTALTALDTLLFPEANVPIVKSLMV